MTHVISVIMPVYDTEQYLYRAIQSIVDQTIENWELILIDDGSTDRSAEMYDQYAKIDPRILAFHQINKGPGAARNNGLKKENGNILLLLIATIGLKQICLSV